MKEIINAFKNSKSLVVQALWICIVAYAAASLNVIIMALLTIDNTPGAYLNPKSSLVFAVVSFILVVIVSIYHISTLLRRRKRRSDKFKLSRAKMIRAKGHSNRKWLRKIAALAAQKK
jgi:membrane protein implicated in regulation of membrane protease activity